MDLVNPESIEACMVKMFDSIAHIEESIASMGKKVNNIEQRVLSIECKMTHMEGEQCGVKKVRTTFTPYILVVISVLLGTIASTLLYYLGFK